MQSANKPASKKFLFMRLGAVVFLIDEARVSSDRPKHLRPHFRYGEGLVGASIAGADVTVRNLANNLVRTAPPDDNGFYTVTNLPVGSYSVESCPYGFQAGGAVGCSLSGRWAPDDRSYAGDGAGNETVQITSVAGETINTTSGEVARVIDSQQVEAWP